MENTLRIRFDKKINKHADVVVKHNIAANIGIPESELFEELEEFKDCENSKYTAFIYDDEIGGTVIMIFGEDEKSAYVEISSDYVCDIIALNEIIGDALNFEET